MRLTSFHEDEAFSDILTNHGVFFSPFDGGLATMSYANFLWTKHKLIGPLGTVEEQWLAYAMDYAKHRYVWDLVSKGYILPEIDKFARNRILHDRATTNNSADNAILHQVDESCQ